MSTRPTIDDVARHVGANATTHRHRCDASCLDHYVQSVRGVRYRYVTRIDDVRSDIASLAGRVERAIGTDVGGVIIGVALVDDVVPISRTTHQNHREQKKPR
jgi:hypothetical protein